MSFPRNPKIVSRQDLRAAREELRRRGRRAVFTNGCFDLLHRGHVEYLRQARALGDALLVGVNGDAGVRALKGPGRPLMGQEERAALVAALEAVSYVTIFEEISVVRLVEEICPDVLVKGGDYGLDGIVGRAIVEASGGQVRALSLWPGPSTSELIARIRALPE